MSEPYSVEPVTKIDEVFPQDTNAYNTLFGGRLMSIMDTAAGWYQASLLIGICDCFCGCPEIQATSIPGRFD